MCFIDGKQGRSDVHGSVAQQWEEPGRVEEKLLGQPARPQGWSLSGGCKGGPRGHLQFSEQQKQVQRFQQTHNKVQGFKVFCLLFLTVS